jgi:GNAT superfamily N-acetyltransferase
MRDMKIDVEIVDYSPRYRSELVEMWRASFEDALGIIDPNPIEDQLRYFDEAVLPHARVVVVLDLATSKVIAFTAFTPNTISQLYVRLEYQRKGIGSLLLDRAKRESAGILRLFTFQSNLKARSFYEQHGFQAIKYGFEPQWALRDVEYEWRLDSK